MVNKSCSNNVLKWAKLHHRRLVRTLSAGKRQTRDETAQKGRAGLEDVFKVSTEAYTSPFYSLYRKLDVAGTQRNILDVAFVLITPTLQAYEL